MVDGVYKFTSFRKKVGLKLTATESNLVVVASAIILVVVAAQALFGRGKRYHILAGKSVVHKTCLYSSMDRFRLVA